MLNATLESARMLSTTVRELTFCVEQDFKFEPGQWVNLYFPGLTSEKGRPLKRAYSIASGPRSNASFDLAITKISDGPGSTGLHAASIGQTFEMTGPHGAFIMAPIERPVMMIATGTGVAPFRSMLQALGGKLQQPVALLFGNRDESEILYRAEFEALANASRLFAFHPTLSRADSTWQGKRGYVQAHLIEIMQAVGGPDCDVYICGLAEMVQDVRRTLRESLGVDSARVHVERFD